MKNDLNDPKSISAKARARRFQQFVHYAGLRGVSNAHVLDMGGTIDYWKMNLQYIPRGLIKCIDVVNLPPRKDKTQTLAGIVLHNYAGSALDRSSLRQDQYDVVYSNSVIEHVGNLRSQKSMANIVQEIGQYYWIQTPAKSFPIEPHFYFPFFAYLPLSLRTLLHEHFQLGAMRRNPNWIDARMTCEETRLLTRSELQRIFEGCEILTERLFGLDKSYIATNMANQGLSGAATPHSLDLSNK